MTHPPVATARRALPPAPAAPAASHVSHVSHVSRAPGARGRDDARVGGRRRIVSAVLAALAVLGLASVTVAPGAHAAARVTVVGLDGGAAASTDGATTLRVSGAGFQSVQGAFGGIYVFFGWVSDPAGGTWAPSKGGQTGADYRYVPDSESADNNGYQRFVAFPGSETAYAANGGEIAADGTWATDLVVPGPVFEAQDRSGAVSEVDCTQVQCGVITIGAHGVRNPSNETFTPVSFGQAASGGAAGGATGTAGTADEAATTAERPPASLGVDQATAVVGRAMSFAAQGFEPGEQVVATLDDGVVAVGPLNAGTHGEVAGIIQLPDDLRAGTHVLTVTGAMSGLTPEAEFTATRDPAEVAAQERAAALVAADQGGGFGGWTWPEIAVAAAGLLLLVVVVVSFVTARRRKGRPAPAPRGLADGARA